MSKTVFEEIRDRVADAIAQYNPPYKKVLVLRPEDYYQYQEEVWLTIEGIERVEANEYMDPNIECIIMSEEDYVRNVVNGIWQEAIDNSNNS